MQGDEQTITMVEGDDPDNGLPKEQLVIMTETEEAVDFTSPFDRLSNETCCHVLSFCDFSSAVRFSRGINRSLRQEFSAGEHFLWKNMFHRHGFSTPMLTQQMHKSTSSASTVDYLLETRKRRQLDQNLLVPKRKKNGAVPLRSGCFNLPNRMFSFVPVTPDRLDAEWDDFDPPPVDFGCDSFILTSAACGGEMVSLDPFHGNLVVHESCLDNAVKSDEGMMEQAMWEAANLIDGHRERGLREDSEEHLAGSVFDQSVYRNHNITQYKKQPFQVLFCLEDDIDLDACFSPLNDALIGTEIDVGYHGIDAKCILVEGQVAGSMIAVGRMITREIGPQLINVREQVVTELFTWERRSDPTSDNSFGCRKLCRFPWSFRTIDVCAVHNRVYASFDSDGGPLSSGRGSSKSTIVVYPLVPYPDCSIASATLRSGVSGAEVCRTKYQDPECFIRCQNEVTSLAVDPTGATLFVGTAAGTCEIWSIHSAYDKTEAKRLAIINIESSMSKALKCSCDDHNGAQQRSVDDAARIGRILTILSRPKIVSFHHPNHLSSSTCGFVTLQHSATDGSSLLLWRKHHEQTSKDAYRIVSMINLPLSGIIRAPRVIYDGRRILVFGQDHIGLIILVYQVLASFEDVALFHDMSKEETSGGVYNLT
jgi:hypothetical protein